MTDAPDISPPRLRRVRSFVVRAGRMTAGQERAWRELFPRYGIEFDGKPIDLEKIFGRRAPLTLEIGFGTGDALLAYAQQHPGCDCLGIEVHPPGVGHLLLQTHAAQLTNVRVICQDAVDVLAHSLPANSVDEVRIFFPDPWHKKRHHKRRLIQASFVNLLAVVMKSGGVVRLATDWQDYAEQMLEVMSAHPAFTNRADPLHRAIDALIDSGEADVMLAAAAQLPIVTPKLPSGFASRLSQRPLTRFERRGRRLGHDVWDLAFGRK